MSSKANSRSRELKSGKAKSTSTKARPAPAKKPSVRPAAHEGQEPDLAAARRVVLDLLAIRGGSGDEKAVAERIVKWLREAGCPKSAIAFDEAHTKTPLKGNVGNLIEIGRAHV